MMVAISLTADTKWCTTPMFLLIAVSLLFAVVPVDAFQVNSIRINRNPQQPKSIGRWTSLQGQADNDGGVDDSQTSSSSSSSTTAASPPALLCIGDALFDCIANDNARGWSVDQIMQSEAHWTAFPGGAPANVATAARKLGTTTAFAGCLGNDAQGDQLVALCDEIGVDTSLVQRSDRPTRQVMVTRSMQGDREFGAFMEYRKPDAFADCDLDRAQLMSSTTMRGARWIVCSTLSLAFPKAADAIDACIDRAMREDETMLYIDVNWRPVFWPPQEDEDDPWKAARATIMELVQKADVVKMTDEEAEWLVGITAQEALEHPKLVHDQISSAKAVLVTAGEKGAAYSVLGNVDRVEPFEVPVTETTGAGDAFTAGFLHGLEQLIHEQTKSSDAVSSDPFQLLQRMEDDDERTKVHQIVEFAAAVGALTCTKEGAIAAQPTFQEVEVFLSKQQNDEL